MDVLKYTLFSLPSYAEKDNAKIAVFGIAFDSSSELGKGSVFFPASIRLSSYSIEWEEKRGSKFISVLSADAIDFFDLLPSIEASKMFEEVSAFLEELVEKGFKNFLIFGGNHSITVPIFSKLAEEGKIKKYLQFDAHADFRQDFMQSKLSFACVARRAYELGLDVSLVGVRSIAEEEKDVESKVNLIPGKEVKERKEEIMQLAKEADYISIDMDVLAGMNVTNPEPYFELDLGFLLELLSEAKPIALDIVEGVPEKIISKEGVAGALIARRILINWSIL